MESSKQVKSRKRVADHGEVFTAEREVNAMLDLVKQETERIDSRFLEPACGDGNFLAEILRRKLTVVKNRYKKSPSDYEKFAVVAVTSIYGVDILQDNVDDCRERLFKIWDEEYKANCKKDVNDDCRKAVKFILDRNILCGESGYYNLCVERKTLGYWYNGVFTKYTVVPEARVQIIPDNVDFTTAAMMEPLACVTHAVYDLTKIVPGDVVLVTGPGAIGIMAAQVAKAHMMYVKEDFADAIRFLADGSIFVDEFITQRYNIYEYKKAFEFIDEHPDDVMKVLIEIAK